MSDVFGEAVAPVSSLALALCEELLQHAPQRRGEGLEGDVLAEQVEVSGVDDYCRSVDIQTGLSLFADNTVTGGVCTGLYNGVSVAGSLTEAYLLRNTITGGTASAGNAYGLDIQNNTFAWARDNVCTGGIGGESRGITVSNNSSAWIYGGQALAGGGTVRSYGVYPQNSAFVRLEGVFIAGNTGVNSRGVNVSSNVGETHIIGCTIDGGAGFYSHGIYVYPNEELYVVNSVINGGSGSDSSTGVYLSSGAPLDAILDPSTTLVNNIINGGTSADTSIGIHLSNSYNVVLAVNNIINGGTGASNSWGISGAGDLTTHNNVIWGADHDCEIWDGATCVSTTTSVNACGWIGCSASSGNIVADPGLDTDNKHLATTNACEDMGTDPSPYFAEDFTDIDDEKRPNGNWDIGVDEVY